MEDPRWHCTVGVMELEAPLHNTLWGNYMYKTVLCMAGVGTGLRRLDSSDLSDHDVRTRTNTQRSPSICMIELGYYNFNVAATLS